MSLTRIAVPANATILKGSLRNLLDGSNVASVHHTAALGAWINSVSTCTHFDSYGYTPAETVQIFDDYEKEYIAD